GGDRGDGRRRAGSRVRRGAADRRLRDPPGRRRLFVRERPCAARDHGAGRERHERAVPQSPELPEGGTPGDWEDVQGGLYGRVLTQTGSGREERQFGRREVRGGIAWTQLRTSSFPVRAAVRVRDMKIVHAIASVTRTIAVSEALRPFDRTKRATEAQAHETAKIFTPR